MTHLRNLTAVAALLGGIGLAMGLVPGDAQACGGCFAPVGQPTVVTAHRMAVSLSPRGTTLWDQIQYAGAPADFAWVLPIKGTIRARQPGSQAPGAAQARARSASIATGERSRCFTRAPPGPTRRPPSGRPTQNGCQWNAASASAGPALRS